ncbi:MAG: hypothetical protein E7381_03160 [Clostridiales bacterium]|nr:hypothetical protein [Clostridiales bacterium]
MRKGWILTLLIAVSVLGGFVACKDDGSSSTDDDKINVEELHWGNPVEELNVSVEQAKTLDFSQYYTMTVKGEPQEVTMDASNFVSPVAGQSYVVKYAYGEKTAEMTVKVYGEPKLELVEESLATLNLTWENRKQLYTGLVAKDSFGEDLSVMTSLTHETEGYQKGYGTFMATHTVTDKVGNKQTLTRTVVIEQKGIKAIADKATDLAHPECLIDDVADMSVLTATLDGETLDEDDWVIGNDYFMLTAKVIATAGVGEHTVSLEFDGAETSFKLTVTDNQAPKYYVNQSALDKTIFVGEDFTLPEAEKDRYSYQDIEVSYKFNNSGIFNPIVKPQKGENKYEVIYTRDDEVLETQTYTFVAVSRAQAEVDAATYADGYEMQWTVLTFPGFQMSKNPASGDTSYFFYWGADLKTDMMSGYSLVSRSNSQFSFGGGITLTTENTVDNMNKFTGGQIFQGDGKPNLWVPFLFTPLGNYNIDGAMTLRLRVESEGETSKVSLYAKHKLADYWDMFFSIKGLAEIKGVTYAGISYGGEQGSKYIEDFEVRALTAEPKTRQITTAAFVADASKRVEMSYTISKPSNPAEGFVGGGYNYVFYNEEKTSNVEKTGSGWTAGYINLSGDMKANERDTEYVPTWSGATWAPQNVANGNTTASVTGVRYPVQKAFENPVTTFNAEPLKSYVIGGKVSFKWTLENVTDGERTTLRVICYLQNASGTYDEIIRIEGLRPMKDNTYVGLFYQNMGCYEKSYITNFSVTQS